MWTVRLLLLFSFLDAYFTDVGLRSHVIEEGNPIANLLYETDVILFYGWKIILPILLLLLYPRLTESRIVSRLTVSVCAVYGVLMLYHAYWLTHAFLV